MNNDGKKTSIPEEIPKKKDVDYLSTGSTAPGNESCASVSSLAKNKRNIKKASRNKQIQELTKKLKDLENEKVNLTSEVQELSEAVFESANDQINEAKKERDDAYKRLRDSENSIDILSAQIKQLKLIIENSESYEPNKNKLNVESFFRGNSLSNKKTKNNNGKINAHDKAASLSHSVTLSSNINLKKFNPPFENLKLFQEWFDLGRDMSSVIIDQLFYKDINLCLDFNKKNLVQNLINLIKFKNPLIKILQKPILDSKCYFSECKCDLKYEIELDVEDDVHFLISDMTRDKIVAVSELFSYLRYISGNLISGQTFDLFNEVSKRCLNLTLVRLGFPIFN